jgi:hypothetical protein
MTNPEKSRKQDPLDELKQTIALGRYEVNSGDVADAILWKIGVLKRLRHELTSEDEEAEAGRTPLPRAPSRSREAGRRPSRAQRDRSS